MIDFPKNGRAFLISYHELEITIPHEESIKRARLFLWDCYISFIKLVQPKKSWHDDLVLLYREDYMELIENYKKIKE